MQKFLCGLIVLLCAQNAFALDVVYPKKNAVVINAKSTFFIGSSDPKKTLTINGTTVNIHPSGGFAYKIQLNTGKNTFTLVSGNEKLIYDITRPVSAPPKTEELYSAPKEYENLKYVSVIKENSPLRSTPVDGGINRIAHLQKGMPLVIDGENSGFYSVILGSNKTGWIAKNNVKTEDSGISLAEMNGVDCFDTDEYKICVFHLNTMTPFELVEGNPFSIKIFNVENNPENTYVMQVPIPKLYGYNGRFSGTDFIVKLRTKPLTDKSKPLKGLKITVDAGHGGQESGASGCFGDLEKNVMLSFAKQLEAELKHRGAQVFMTRTDDSYVDLQKRVDMANEENSLVFISLHGNALPDEANPAVTDGTEIYYYYNQAKPLAESILREICLKTGMKNRKTHQASFAVVRNTNALSILIETGYLINPSDNAKLIKQDFQKQMSSAIANGLETFFKSF